MLPVRVEGEIHTDDLPRQQRGGYGYAEGARAREPGVGVERRSADLALSR